MNVVVLARTSALPPETCRDWVAALTGALRAQGQTVAVVDGSMVSFPPKIRREDVDTVSINSVWESGVQEVLLAHAGGAALFTRFEPAMPTRPPELDGLIGLLDPRIDWVLALGFDQAGYHKLECWRPDAPERPLYPDDPFVAALVCDEINAQPQPPTLRPALPLHDAEQVVQWLLHEAQGRFDWATQQGGYLVTDGIEGPES